MVIALHWEQFISLFGWGTPQFDLLPRTEPLPWPYLAIVLGATALFEVLPYTEELVRGLRKSSVSRS
jgi:hypothetical protein